MIANGLVAVAGNASCLCGRSGNIASLFLGCAAMANTGLCTTPVISCCLVCGLF